MTSASELAVRLVNRFRLATSLQRIVVWVFRFLIDSDILVSDVVPERKAQAG